MKNFPVRENTRHEGLVHWGINELSDDPVSMRLRCLAFLPLGEDIMTRWVRRRPTEDDVNCMACLAAGPW